MTYYTILYPGRVHVREAEVWEGVQQGEEEGLGVWDGVQVGLL